MKEIEDKKTGELTTLDGNVPVSIPERQVTELETVEAMKRSGNVVVGEHYLKDLETIGIHARRGMLKMQRGRAMVNQRRMEIVLESALEKLTSAEVQTDKKTVVKDGKILMTPGDYAKCIQAFSQLSSTLTQSQAFATSMEEIVRPAAAPQDPDQENSSFAPGSRVQAAGTQIFTHETHIHPQADVPALKEKP